jgi:S-adenosylmethionine decarboxylase
VQWHNHRWRRRYDRRVQDLAPDIVRQRLLIEGYFTTDVDEVAIERYFDGLTSALDLRVYGSPTIFAPGGLGRDENQGYDAFVPLIDSGISLYVWSQPRFLSAVVFTCKRFDADRAVEFTRDFFAMSEVASQQF